MKTILITGGSGFLGRNLALSLKDRYKVVLGARNNGNNQLAQIKTDCIVTPLDITNPNSIADNINEFKPDIIIHAAATKFVDISEKYPMECIDVNVIGSQLLARVAMEKGVEAVIGISTDKAAPPVGNIYGHSKAIMERMFASLDEKSNTNFVSVRFGNIAWSTGSVFPLWKRMTETNGEIESTGPHMRRFFFSVDTATDLVITALENHELLHGGVLSLKMKSAQIEDILNVWADTHQVKWKKIQERPGDKIDEVLVGDIELPFTEEITINNKQFYLLKFNHRVSNPISQLVSSENAPRLNTEEIKKLIASIPKI